ncbi:MAG: hypothetical protein KAW19_05795 [Candidatus Aminicenantes bacterium]|nr:hypothetical protein [Candidatus Aminicenantes bacterium]
MFSIITILSMLGLVFLLTFLYFRSIQERDIAGEDSTDITFSAYFSWLFRRISGFFRAVWIKRCRELFQDSISQRYPAGQRWIIICLGLSFLFLAASGFLFTLLGTQRLYGLPLLLHVLAGGLFAVSLSLVVVLRARCYSFDIENPELKKDLPAWRQKILFWLFVVSGFLLIITALAMMLPFFSLNSQQDLFEVHRYSALVALLSAAAFTYFALLEEGK